jgi:hypothetical protein
MAHGSTLTRTSPMILSLNLMNLEALPVFHFFHQVVFRRMRCLEHPHLANLAEPCGAFQRRALFAEACVA